MEHQALTAAHLTSQTQEFTYAINAFLFTHLESKTSNQIHIQTATLKQDLLPDVR